MYLLEPNWSISLPQLANICVCGGGVFFSFHFLPFYIFILSVFENFEKPYINVMYYYYYSMGPLDQSHICATSGPGAFQIRLLFRESCKLLTMCISCYLMSSYGVLVLIAQTAING